MHSKDLAKSPQSFGEEIDAILNGSSQWRHQPERLDFSHYVFPSINFRERMFPRKAVFHGAIFTQEISFAGSTFGFEAIFSMTNFLQVVSFHGTRFESKSDFEDAKFTAAIFQDVQFNGETTFTNTVFADGANFTLARFAKLAHFEFTKFNRYGNFFGAVFHKEATFIETVFGFVSRDSSEPSVNPQAKTVADFSHATFDQPASISFYRVNQASSQGFLVRFIDCNVEQLQLVDVNWHRHTTRLVLQDEIDLQEPEKQTGTTHELVRIAYRQLINNFDKVRAYDLADECWVGVMDLNRFDPARSAFSRFTVVVYQLLSVYGTSYTRALVVLLGSALFVFPLLFTLGGLAQSSNKASFSPSGLIHSLEVATFMSNTHYLSASALSWGLEIFERIFVPAQLSLFLLALRSRFRR
jgi:uncharacterized protein YjbI with pentapeptide repeats